MFWNRKNKFDELLNRIDNQSEEISKLKEQNDRIERILKHSKPGEITWNWAINNTFYWINPQKIYYTYLYVCGEEYIFEGLHLHNPKFTIGESKNIIYVTDIYDSEEYDNSEKHCDSYVLDTSTCTYIQTKKR